MKATHYASIVFDTWIMDDPLLLLPKIEKLLNKVDLSTGRRKRVERLVIGTIHSYESKDDDKSILKVEWTLDE